MLRVTPEPQPFSLAEARHLVEDLFDPKPWVYWTDFLVSITIGYTCFAVARRVLPPLIVEQGYPAYLLVLFAAVFLVQCLALYRASLFIHEIVHFKKAHLKRFRVVWNLLCGIPFLTPTFLYYTHLDHHRRKFYGTDHDGEYLPLGRQRPIAILIYLAQIPVIPILGVLRFLVFAPISWVSPQFKRWMQQHASSMVMDPSYVRPLPAADVIRIWRIQETACFLLCFVIAIRLLTGQMPWAFLAHAYATGLVVLTINAVRTLGAHRFINDGSEMTFTEQLLDSINYPHRPLITGLWAPIGLRFHALHHLFPSMPYHNLAEAHQRLVENLPADSPYHLTEGKSLTHALYELVVTSFNNPKQPKQEEPLQADAA